MSNLISNGDFSNPNIATNSTLNYDAFTTAQITDLIWVGADYGNSSSITLLDGTSTLFVYQNPSVIGVSQYLQIRAYASISQTINNVKKGRYLFSFYYCKRQTVNSNYPTYIYFDNILVATLQSTIPETWTIYTCEINVKTTGNKLLKLQQPIVTTNPYNIAFTKFSLIAFETIPECGSLYLPPLNYSDDKNFNIEDYDYQDKTLTIRDIDTRFIKNNQDQTLDGSLRITNDIISEYFLSQPTEYFTGVQSNLQNQIYGIINDNVG